MAGTKNRLGGRRPGSGGIPTDSPATIGKFSPQARQELRTLYLAQRAIRGPRFSQRQLIEEWIHEKWLEYDEHIQSVTEQMEEFIA
jgi:hypothetical protein